MSRYFLLVKSTLKKRKYCLQKLSELQKKKNLFGWLNFAVFFSVYTNFHFFYNSCLSIKGKRLNIKQILLKIKQITRFKDKFILMEKKKSRDEEENIFLQLSKFQQFVDGCYVFVTLQTNPNIISFVT